MQDILTQVINKLNHLNLININSNLCKNIIFIAIYSVQNYIKHEIDSYIDFSLINDIFVDIIIGEYLILIKNSHLDENLDFDTAIKSISEGDVSITYFTDANQSKLDCLNQLISYFLSKKSLLHNFKSIRW